MSPTGQVVCHVISICCCGPRTKVRLFVLLSVGRHYQISSKPVYCLPDEPYRHHLTSMLYFMQTVFVVVLAADLRRCGAAANYREDKDFVESRLFLISNKAPSLMSARTISHQWECLVCNLQIHRKCSNCLKFRIVNNLPHKIGTQEINYIYGPPHSQKPIRSWIQSTSKLHIPLKSIFILSSGMASKCLQLCSLQKYKKIKLHFVGCVWSKDKTIICPLTRLTKWFL